MMDFWLAFGITLLLGPIVIDQGLRLWKWSKPESLVYDPWPAPRPPQGGSGVKYDPLPQADPKYSEHLLMVHPASAPWGVSSPMVPATPIPTGGVAISK